MARFAKLAIGILAVGTALAQQRLQPVVPHIGFVYPAGGKQGTTVEVTVGGQYLNNAGEAYVSGAGIKATEVRWVRPITAVQANEFREQLQKLNEKRTAANKAQPEGSPKITFTAEDEKTAADLQKKLQEFSRRPSSPAIAETVIVQITIAPDAPTGVRELRVGATPGFSNPLPFYVGQLPEYSRAAAKVPFAFNVVNGATPPNRPARAVEPPMEIALPAIVNGQMMPGATDRYRFHAGKGQHLVVAAHARDLIPYISDAVPGWFQAAVTVRDSSGKELAAADHYRFHPDPVLHCEIPADGDYVLEVRDSIYRGREDFVYRIEIGELPFITGIFPLGGKTGSRTKIETIGWNLPAASLAQDFKGKQKGLYPVSVRNRGAVSNALPFDLDNLPETAAKQGNSRKEKAQRVKLPVVVNGRVDHPGESDFFRFDGKAGEEIVAEVFARRLDSPLDSMLRLTDAAGRELAFNDDFEDKGAGLLTHQADSRLAFKLPAKGTYYLQLGDTQRKGGPEYAYRLRISHPEPDFELRVVPSSVNVRAGMSVPITVYALRRDGFAGQIALKLKDVPQGFMLGGGAVPAGEDKVRLTLSSAPGRVDVPMTIQLEGQAEINGREVRHRAIPAEDMMQAFAYHHLVPEAEWVVRVIGAAQARFAMRTATEQSIRVPAGGTVPIQVVVPPRLAGEVQFALDEAPEGLSIQSVTQGRAGASVLLRAEPGKIKPGVKGNLIVDAFVERPNPAGGATARRRQWLGTLPAIPFEIVPR